MNSSHFVCRSTRRDGKIALLTALLLTVMMGIMACALDLGWVTMTKTQMRAATDSASLAGGTEFLPGLGRNPSATPVQVEANVRAQAVFYAASNPAGDRTSVYVDISRDIRVGNGKMNPATGQWTFQWGVSPYNAVRVTSHRDIEGSGAGDHPLPLFFAPAIGIQTSDLAVFSTAVILPVSGIRILPGSNVSSGLAPFSLDRERWRKYLRAQDHFENSLGNDPSLIAESILDDGPDGDGHPLYYEEIEKNNSVEYKQIFDDEYQVIDAAADQVSPGVDGVLEINLYPIRNVPGNFGTVDVGDPGNSTADLKRQIEFGPNEDDLSYFPNSTISPSDESPMTFNGDTGISAGIEDTIESILGECRVIFLHTNISENGNNAEYTIVDMVGTRWMHVDFRGNDKKLLLQPCPLSDPAGVPDFDTDIDESTTVFTPLILAE